VAAIRAGQPIAERSHRQTPPGEGQIERKGPGGRPGERLQTASWPHQRPGRRFV